MSKTIFYIITGLRIGGAEMIVRDLAVGINKEKYKPIVISLRSGGVIKDEIKNAGIEVIELGKGVNPFIKIVRLMELIRMYRPIIIHTHLFHADIIGRIAGTLLRVPVIVSSIQNISFGGVLRERLLAITKNMVTVFVAVSRNVRDVSLKKNIVLNDNCVVIHNSVHPEHFSNMEKRIARSELEIKNETTVLVATGRLIEQKGFEYLIKAIKMLNQKYSNIILYILGEGVLRSELENLIQESGQNTIIFLKGNVANVNVYLAAADIFVMPSLWEGFSVALLEAAVSQTVIIATPVGGNEELIKDKENGFIVQPKNVKALSDAIEYVIVMSDSKKEEIMRKAHDKVVNEFSVKKMIHDHEQLYEKYI